MVHHIPFCWFWRLSFERIIERMCVESKQPKGWRVGVMVRVAMVKKERDVLFWGVSAKWGRELAVYNRH